MKGKNDPSVISLNDMRGLWDKLVTASGEAEGFCSKIDSTFREGGVLVDLCFGPSQSAGIPRIVSIIDEDDCHDSISDICENRHCSQKPERSSTSDSRCKPGSRCRSDSRQVSPSSSLRSRDAEHRMSSVVHPDHRPRQLVPSDIPSVVYDRPRSKKQKKKKTSVALPDDIPRLIITPDVPPSDFPAVITTKTKRRFGYI